MQYERTRILLGDDAITKLHSAHVAIFGVGGVGGYVAEALARSGVGTLTLVDNDTVSITNLNRQIIATHATIGMSKVMVVADRIHDIDPNIKVIPRECFFLPETADTFDFSEYDYVVDAIDTVTGKLSLVQACKAVGTPIICAMGAGNKMDPSKFQVADISKTSVCPLARIMRKECSRRGIKKLKVVYSTELPLEPNISPEALEELKREHPGKQSLPGSNAFVPGAAGLLLASEVVKDLIGYGK